MQVFLTSVRPLTYLPKIADHARSYKLFYELKNLS